jgi:putative hemolysin
LYNNRQERFLTHPTLNLFLVYHENHEEHFYHSGSLHCHRYFHCRLHPADPPGNDSNATITAMMTVSPTSAGMANPASVNCGKIGGTTEIKKNPDGSEYGMCTFPNGTS